MTVLITLTVAGADSGPFDLYGNLDGYIVPFEVDVPKSSLLSGFSSPNVPDYTSTVKCVSKGVCTNYILVPLSTTTTSTTTTTTTTEIPCGSTSSSGGEGITESTISLSSLGGVIIIEFNASSIPDKLEIIHNEIKKATSGMTTANYGPSFDNLYGTPPTNTIPTDVQTASVDQFIGSSKGTIPTRNTEFLSDTGISGITVESGYQQLIWFKYTPTDFANSNFVTIRVTGPNGTSWNLKRLCAP